MKVIIFLAIIHTIVCDLTEEGLLSFDENDKKIENIERFEENVEKINDQKIDIEYNNQNDKLFKNNIIHL